MEKKANIFASLFILANRLQVLGDSLDEQITIKQWLLIAVISKSNKEAITVSELSKFIGSSRQNVKKMADILERQGFVSLNKDPNDARVVQVSITEKCINHFKSRADLELNFIEKLFNDFDEELLDGLYRGINKLSSNVTEMEIEKGGNKN